MPSNKKNITIPITGGINQSVDGFVVQQSNRVAQNVIQSKDGIVSSGYTLSKVVKLGDSTAGLNSIVESSGTPVAVGYSGYVRMDNGVSISNTLCPSVGVESAKVSIPTRYPSNAHSALLLDGDMVVTCVVYRAHDSSEMYYTITRGDSLPLVNRKVILSGLDGEFKNGRVFAVQDSTAFSSVQSSGRVFVMLGANNSGDAVYRVYSPVDGSLVAFGSVGSSQQWNDYSVGCAFGDRVYGITRQGAAWRGTEIKWSAPGSITTVINTLTAASTEPNTPLAAYAWLYDGERTLYWVTRSGDVSRRSFESAATATYTSGIRYHLASIGVQLNGKVVVLASQFERVGGLTTMGSSRPIFGDLEHFDTPPGSPEDYHHRVNSDLYYITQSSMTLSSHGVVYGAAPASQMFAFYNTFASSMSMFVQTSFPNASTDIRTAASQKFVTSSAGLNRITPAHDQAFYPGSPAPTDARPYNDGEPFTFGGPPPTTLARPAGKVMGAAINENKSPKRVNLGPLADALSYTVGLPLNDVANAIQDSVTKDRNREKWPDIGSIDWSSTGASVAERQNQAMFWGINDVATANWYESDSKLVLIELRESLVATTQPFAVLGVMPGTPYHRQLAATSASIKVPCMTQNSGVISENDIMPDGYFQTAFTDDIGGFAQLPLVGVYGESVIYPQVTVESFPDSFSVVTHKLDATRARTFQLPGKSSSVSAGSAGAHVMDSNQVFFASPSPPHWIALGEAESIGSITDAKINNYDRRRSGNADSVPAGMVYVRYRWTTADGPSVSALSPPIMVLQRQLFNPEWILSATTSGVNSSLPTTFAYSSPRLALTDNSLYLTTRDSSTPGNPPSYYRRPILVNAPISNADTVELDVFIDPWLAQWSKSTTGGAGFVSTTYPYKITYAPNGQPMYCGTIRPEIENGKLKFYLGLTSNASNELPFFGPDSSGRVAEEALEPRPFSIPAVKSTGSYGGRSIAITSDNVVYYSKNLVGPPEFSDELTISPPPGSGDVTAVVSFEDQLILLCESRIYRLTGVLPDTTDSASLDWSVVSTTIGCNNRNGIIVTKFGLLFQSSLGLYVLTPGGDLQFIGKPVIDETSEACVAAAQSPDEQSIFVFFANKILVLNTSTETWSKITIPEPSEIVDARMVGDNVYTLLRGNDPSLGGGDGFYSVKLIRLADASGVVSYTGSEVLSTGWVSTAGANSFQRCTRIALSGKCSGSISGNDSVTLRVYVNNRSTVDCEQTFDLSSLRDSDGNFRFVIHPKTQKCSSIRLEVETSSPVAQPVEYVTMGTKLRPEVVYYGVNFEMVDKGSSTRSVGSTSKG